jgi:hypothetical protein
VRRVRARFWFEAGAAIVTGLLALVTVFWRDWIEVTGWEPDHHNGTVEWLMVGVLATVTVFAALLTRIEWRRSAVAA